MSLTKEQLEDGLKHLRKWNTHPNGEKSELNAWIWCHENLEDLFQMAKASLEKENKILDLDNFLCEPSTMKEAIEALRGFAPDFPQEPILKTIPAASMENVIKQLEAQPEPANCCGNCRHFLTDKNDPIGICEVFEIGTAKEYGRQCTSHQRKLDATNI